MQSYHKHHNDTLPKMDNQRIIRQSGAFFLFGINSNKKQLADFVQTPLRIVIDKTAKKNILKELSRIGIENSTLFPINNMSSTYNIRNVVVLPLTFL